MTCRPWDGLHSTTRTSIVATRRRRLIGGRHYYGCDCATKIDGLGVNQVWLCPFHAGYEAGAQGSTLATAAELWAMFSDAPMACQDCFTVELTHDPSWGPVLQAHSCTADVDACRTMDELVVGVHAAKVGE